MRKEGIQTRKRKPKLPSSETPFDSSSKSTNDNHNAPHANDDGEFDYNQLADNTNKQTKLYNQQIHFEA